MITRKWFGWRELGRSGGVEVEQDGGKGLNAENAEIGARKGTERRQAPTQRVGGQWGLLWYDWGNG